MQYQHEQQQPRAPFPSYPDFQEPMDPLSRGLFWPSSNAYSGYPRPYDYIQEDLLLDPTEAMSLADQKRATQRGGNTYPQLYEPANPNEFLRSPALSNGHGHPQQSISSFASKEIFPQEYYDHSITDHELESSSSVSSQMGRYSHAIPAESGLNIEASAFLPSSANRSSVHMSQLPHMPQTVDQYNLMAMDRNGPRHVVQGSLAENVRVPSYVSSETEMIHHRNIGDDPQADDLSEYIDHSLSPSNTDHHHVVSETETVAPLSSPPHGF